MEGKVVLITGASSGIGEATAKQFAKLGASLVITGRNIERLTKVETECRELGAKDVLGVRAEFEKLQDIKNVFEKTIARYQMIDILVNNAGVGHRAILADVKMEDFDYVVKVNLKSVLCLTQLVMPYLVKSNGCVVSVSSSVSHYASPHKLVYSMCKAAVDQFTRSLALQYAPKGVRVNAVNPDIVETRIARNRGMNEEETKKMFQSYVKDFPLGRIGTTEDIASAIIFLAGDSANWITGQCLVIDGGKTLMEHL